MDEEKRLHYVNGLTQNLPVLRSKLGVTQAELADRIGVTRHTLMAIEKGKRPMTWMMFTALVAVLQRDPGADSLLHALEIRDGELEEFFTFKNR